MFHKFLVCSDGSEGALNAVRAGARLAQRLGSSVVLLDVLNSNSLEAYGIGESSLSIPASSIEDIACSQQEAVQIAAAPVFEAAGVTPQYLHARGHPVGTIVATAQREECDLIVLGSHGQSAVGSFLSGSVAEGVLRHASCSVLIVPGSGEAERASEFQHILLATDASADAHKATEVALELAAKFHAALTIVNVYEKPGLLAEAANAFGELYPQEQQQRVLEAIQHSMRDAATLGVSCTLRPETGHVAETILRVAAEEKPDMVVVGHRGQGGFQSLLLGSVSGRVAQHAQCPVLVTR